MILQIIEVDDTKVFEKLNMVSHGIREQMLIVLYTCIFKVNDKWLISTDIHIYVIHFLIYKLMFLK